MRDRVIAAIEEIRGNNFLSTMDEASVISVVVERLLSVMGWNIHNNEEVKHEHPVGSKAVDLCLKVSGASKVIIEAKRANENLFPHQKQLLEYSFIAGVPHAILTNGIEWWFFLPLKEGEWDQRRFYDADLLRMEPGLIAENFIELLSRENVTSGNVVKKAENLYESRPRGGVYALTGPSSDNLNRLQKIAKWASNKGIMLPNKGQEGNIRIRGKNKNQVALFRQEDGQIYIVLKESSYAGRAEERDALVKELKGLGLYPQSLNPYKIADGKMLTKKLYELDDEEIAELLEILEKHC